MASKCQQSTWRTAASLSHALGVRELLAQPGEDCHASPMRADSHPPSSSLCKPESGFCSSPGRRRSHAGTPAGRASGLTCLVLGRLNLWHRQIRSRGGNVNPVGTLVGAQAFAHLPRLIILICGRGGPSAAAQACISACTLGLLPGRHRIDPAMAGTIPGSGCRQAARARVEACNGGSSLALAHKHC